MSNEIIDLNGDVVAVGEPIAAAFRVGNVAELRTGVIEGFGERGNNLTVIVRWDDGSRTSGIEAHLRRFVKIGRVNGL